MPPIAMLHYVSDGIDASLKEWCIKKSSFVRLLDTIQNAGITTTHFKELAENKTGRRPAKKVILTFDDCAKLLFDFAIPELLKRNMKAAFYIPTADIGGSNSWDVKKGAATLPLMDAADLQQLAGAGMEIGSHSHHHIELQNVRSARQLKQEVTVSKQLLESILGQPVYSFAYPYGSVPAGYQSLLSEAGYRYAVSIYQPFETDLALRRFGIYDKDTTKTVTRKLSARYKWSRTIYDVIKKY